MAPGGMDWIWLWELEARDVHQCFMTARRRSSRVALELEELDEHGTTRMLQDDSLVHWDLSGRNDDYNKGQASPNKHAEPLEATIQATRGT